MRIVIENDPIPLKRARLSKNKFYDPQYVAKKNFSLEVKNKLDKTKVFPTYCPIKLIIEFHIKMANSWSKKKKERLLMAPHTGKTDLDNYVKWIGDSLNNVIWVDDSQIYQIDAKKLWNHEGKTVLDIYILEEK